MKWNDELAHEVDNELCRKDVWLAIGYVIYLVENYYDFLSPSFISNLYATTYSFILVGIQVLHSSKRRQKRYT
jgi:hypothetical protein